MWDESEICVGPALFLDVPALFSDFARSLSRTKVSCESLLIIVRSGTSQFSGGGGGREEGV
jgi:hypothetical protein